MTRCNSCGELLTETSRKYHRCPETPSDYVPNQFNDPESPSFQPYTPHPSRNDFEGFGGGSFGGGGAGGSWDSDNSSSDSGSSSDSSSSDSGGGDSGGGGGE